MIPRYSAADDGIVLRIPQTETRLPGAELFVFDPDELDRIVRDRVDATSLFAARFRECAARALLMSPTTPGKRAPLWQQRLKAGQLLEAARREQEFPILLETARECLQDVYDLPALHELHGADAGGQRPAGGGANFRPVAVRGAASVRLRGRPPVRRRPAPCRTPRVAALAGPGACWASFWARRTWPELLDADVVTHTVQAQLQRVAPDRRVRGVEGVADLLRALGPLSAEEVAARMQADRGDRSGGRGRTLGGRLWRAAADTAAQGREAVVEGADAVSHDGAADPASLQEAEAALAVLCDSHRAFPARISVERSAGLPPTMRRCCTRRWAWRFLRGRSPTWEGPAEMVLADRPGAADGWGWSGGPDEF